MKQFLAIILILLVFSQNLQSQTKDLQIQRFEITFMPYSLIDYSPRLRLGLEYYSSEKLGYSLDFGFGNDGLKQMLDYEVGKNYSLFELRAELKYFFILKEHFALYSGPELFSIHTTEALQNDWYRKSQYPLNENFNMVTHFDFATFNRQKYGAHIKVGVKLIAFNRIDFDFYAGLGLAYRTIEYSQVVNPVDTESYRYYDGWSRRNVNEGDSFLFHIALGGKVGYILWKN